MSVQLPIEDGFPDEVKERLTWLNSNPQYIQSKLDSIPVGEMRGHCDNLMRQAFAATNTTKRLFWLRREAEAMLSAVGPQSACKKGCHACCHQGVMMSEAEARVIAKETGLSLHKPPEGKTFTLNDEADRQDSQEKKRVLSSEFIGESCPMLDSNSECSIYACRPMACRNLVNMDSDALLCKLVPDIPIPVPYLNRSRESIGYGMLMGVNIKVADIRYFFKRK